MLKLGDAFTVKILVVLWLTVNFFPLRLKVIKITVKVSYDERLTLVMLYVQLSVKFLTVNPIENL